MIVGMKILKQPFLSHNIFHWSLFFFLLWWENTFPKTSCTSLEDGKLFSCSLPETTFLNRSLYFNSVWTLRLNTWCLHYHSTLIIKTSPTELSKRNFKQDIYKNKQTHKQKNKTKENKEEAISASSMVQHGIIQKDLPPLGHHVRD